MCGIAGIFIANSELPDRTKADLAIALSRLQRRGPDDEGTSHIEDHRGETSVKGHVGHRRLSIVDVAGGHQPLAHDDGSILVFNGEIYNFETLRKSFRDVQWKTRSDTEVLLHVLKRDGFTRLADLNGMFAFAYWDSPTRKLWLARDAAGEKPLYYSVQDNRLAFASELHAILALLPGSPTPDREALAGYLQLGYFASPSTAFDGVRKLEPGQWLCWDSGRVETGHYWSPFAVAPTRPMRDGALLELVEDCVRSRLIGERRIGVFLSGGVDSSLVAALVARVLGPTMTHSFSIGFDDPAFDESQYSSAVSGYLGTRHHHRRLSLQDVRGSISEALLALDEPNADASILPTYLLSRFAAEHITVSLGGDGGDELFAGYRTHSLHRLMHWAERVPGLSSLVRQIGIARDKGHWFRPRSGTAPLHRHLGSVTLFSPQEVGRWLPEVPVTSPLETAWHEQVLGTETSLADILKLDFRFYLGDCVLQKVDRASMAHSLEVRAPLLDRRLVDYALGLPVSRKFDLHRGKAPLRRLLAGLVPPSLWNQRKQGFSVPLDRWFREGLLAELQASVGDLDFWGLPASGQILTDAQAAGSARVPHRLWSLFVLALSARRYR